MDDFRVMIFDQTGAPLYDLTPDQIFGLQRTEAINGEHKLVITTAQVLAQGQRVLMRDGMLKWREYVITGGDQAHQNGARPIGTYQAVWSLQYDLSGVTCDKQPGIRTGATAREALVAALSGTKRWAVGTVTVGTTAGASMWQRSAWEALSVLVENWGGEIDATITVGSTGVTSRAVDLLDSVGKSSATRRFEYGVDLVSINRKVIEGVQYCRIIPLGAGYADGIDSSDSRRRVTIEELTPGNVEWLQNDAVAPYVRVPDGIGGYEYPTKFVIYDGVKTPEELLAVAQRDLAKYTTPQVTYTASVFQYAEAGIDVSGVALGDPVQVVDTAFYDGLRLEARITKLVVDELDPASTTVTIGNITDTIATAFTKIGTQVNALSNEIIDTNATMADYINNILDEVNAKVNATGGYTYLVPGRGMVTYDVPVPDFSDDSAAHQVTEIRGGTLRFANSRDSSGNWQYKTVILSGYINTDLIQAQSIEASKISTSLMEIITEWGDYIYSVSGGVLVTKKNGTIGVLVNSSGSVDIVTVSWSNDVPSVASGINKFGTDIELMNQFIKMSAVADSFRHLVSIISEKYRVDANGNEIIDVVYDHPRAGLNIEVGSDTDGTLTAGADLKARLYNGEECGLSIYYTQALVNQTLELLGQITLGVGAKLTLDKGYYNNEERAKLEGDLLQLDFTDYEVTTPVAACDALAINDYMLGTSSASLPNGADLNDYQTPGVYITGGNATTSSITHLPVANTATRLIVLTPYKTGTYIYIIQLAFTYTGRIFIRHYISGSGNWQGWREIQTTAI